MSDQNRTLVARLVRKMRKGTAKPKTFDRRAGGVGHPRRQYKTTRHGRGLLAMRALAHWLKRRRHIPRRTLPRVVDHVRALFDLERAQRRADARKAEQAREAAREAAGDCLFDDCMALRNTQPAQMAWPERREDYMMNWSVFEASWDYDRGVRAYVKHDPREYSHWH
jgi:hypothetical protein